MDAQALTEDSSLLFAGKSEKHSISTSLIAATSLFQSGRQLNRSLGAFQAFCYVVGILMGSGLFVSPSFVARETSSMGLALIAWIVCGVICLFGALCFCELASTIQKSGGEYIFIKEIYGDIGGFITIWAQMFIIYPTAFALVSETFAGYCISPFYDLSSNSGFWIMKTAACFTMCISFTINCISISFVSSTQTIFTMVQTLAILFIVALGIWKVSVGHIQNYVSMFTNTKAFDPKDLGVALYNSLWAYDGWGYICILTEEIKNPSRNLPLSVMTGIPFVIVCYVLVNLAFMSCLSHTEIANSPYIATAFVNKVLGHNAAIVVSVAAAISCFGSNNACLCVVARSLLSASREGHLPQPLSYIHKKRLTPIPALFLEFVLSIIWILSVRSGLQTFVMFFSFAVWLTYGMALFGVVILRFRQPNLPRPFKVWIVNPIFMSLVSLYLIIAPFAKKPIESGICLLLMLSAVPVYYIFVLKHSSLPTFIIAAKERCYVRLLRLFNLVPCVFVYNEVRTSSMVDKVGDTTLQKG